MSTHGPIGPGTGDESLPRDEVPSPAFESLLRQVVRAPAAGAAGTRYIQHYELIRELGRGAMGVVYLARDVRLARLVAIKMLTRPSHRDERFLAEARATARCRHENIVDVAPVDGRPALE